MSQRDLHEQASALFLQIRSLPHTERKAALLAADEDVRHEVRSLLEHDSPDTPHPGAVAPAPPSRIGPYSILGTIGRGGSGLVLLAEQHEPVRRRVAIKLVPHAALSPEFAARFDFERRALERTEHPNIARILDAGRTPDGLPYLVMDYVQGLPITEHCTSRSLPLRDRISLVIEVTDGVQHAHQRGVIHRDLKPANILVGDVDGRPVPRILDFGIARPVLGTLETTAPLTSGLPMGTPAYMAPEQTGGRSVDTRADVYALGALLYELTSGQRPVELNTDPMESLRRIREYTPFPASRIRARHPEFAGDPAPRSLLADLDCILAKALEKDPARRYATAAAFAQDLRSLLRGKPIDARPAALSYRAARFAQRNRALVAVCSAAALALALGLAGLAIGFVEARLQRSEATTQRDAQLEINRFLTEDLLGGASPEQEGQNITALDLLHRAARKVDRRFPDRPLIAAAVHHTLGNAFMELGAFEDAQTHLDRAIALRTQTAGPDAPDTVRSQVAAASLLGRRSRLAEAEPALALAVSRARRILGPDDPALYSALNDQATILQTLDRAQEAEPLLAEALEGRTRLFGHDDPLVLITTSNLAQVYDRLGQTDRSLQLDLDALRIADSLDDPPRMTIIGLCNNIGATYQDLSRDREAQPYLERAAQLASTHLGLDSPDTLTLQGNLASLYAELGDPNRGADIYDAAIKSWTKLVGPDAIETLTARYGYWNCIWIGKRPADAAAGYAQLAADTQRALGEKHWMAIQTQVARARALLDAGRADEALPIAQDAADRFTAIYGPDHGRTRAAFEIVRKINAARSAAGNAP